jgi:Na+/H+ antiporter NhaC
MNAEQQAAGSGARPAETWLGHFGGLLPLLVMIISMIVMVANGMGSTRNFWAAGLFAMVAGFLVYKDKSEFQKAVLAGIQDHIFAYMLACFLLAGIMSKILTSSHLVDALLYIMSRANVSPALMPIVCFIIAMILSTATGSAATSVNASGPVLIPLAVGMGCDANVICGAILAGGCFGDNLAPISDTTIASSLTQEVDTMRVVKSRLKYSIIAGIVSAAAYIALGVSRFGGTSAAATDVSGQYLSSLIFLVVPLLAVVLMLRKKGLFTSFIISELVGFVLLFAFGYVSLPTLVAKDGLIPSAFDGMVGTIIFLLFIFVMVSLISNAGVLDWILGMLRHQAKSDRAAEITAGGMVCLVSIAISSGTSAIAFCGPIIRRLLRPFHIDRARCANILDGLGCGVGYLVPTNPGCLNLAAVAVATGVVSEGYSPLSFVGYNFQSMALFVVFWFAILSGWGRTHETDEQLRADGVDPYSND